MHRDPQRYTVRRYRYSTAALDYEQTAEDDYATLAAAKTAARRAEREDGATPDIFDNLTGDYIQ